jgi:tetratricopeptide (TPR) repeat protein
MMRFLAISVVLTIAVAAVSQTITSSREDAHVAQVALQARSVLVTHCGKCHGKDSTAGLSVLDSRLIREKMFVQPGSPDKSRIYIRVALSPSDPMPPRSEHDTLRKEEIDVLRAWIVTGATDPASASLPKGTASLIEAARVLHAIRDDLEAAPERDRPYYRYFTLNNLINEGATATQLAAYRAALSKLLNSLSWHKRISIPASIDKEGAVLRIDLRNYMWTAEMWRGVIKAYPYAVAVNSDDTAKVTALSQCDLPFLRTDWFVARAALPPLYHDLLSLPGSAQALEARLGVDVQRDLDQDRAIRAGIAESGVSRNNRVLERHETAFGAYWRSYDFSSNADRQNIFKVPLDFHAAGGELIFSLPNGLQGYMLVNGTGQRIDTGPIDIVSNKENAQDPVVRNGLTCMSCHSQGMKRFTDQMRSVIKASGAGTVPFDRNKALALYGEPARMSPLLDEDARRFADSVRATGAEVQKDEPIVAMQKEYDSALDLERAAAEVGMTPAALREAADADHGLATVIGVLLTPGGRMKRDAWEESVEDLSYHLKLGQYLRESDFTRLVDSAARALYDRRDSEAASQARDALGKFSGNARAHAVLGHALLREGSNDGAASEFEEALRLNDATPLAHSGRGLLLDEKRDYAGAMKEFARAVELDPGDALPHALMAVSLRDQGKLEQAEAQIDEAKRLDPKLPLLHAFAASIHIVAKQESAAEEELKAALIAAPQDVGSLSALGDVYITQHRYLEAAQQYRKAVQLNPKSAAIRFNFATALEQARQYGEAEQEYHRVLEINPRHNGAYNGLGNILNSLRRFPEAEQMYRKAIDLGSKDPVPYINLGSAYFNQQLYTESERQFRMAVKLDPANPSSHNNLGSVYLMQNRPSDAIREFEKAVRLDPNSGLYSRNLERAVRYSKGR